MRSIRSVVIGATLSLLAFSAAADNSSPMGRWKTLDDETGKAMTIVEVYEARGGTLAAKIVENIAAPATCDKCSGANRGKSIIGMPILWGLQRTADGWGNGRGFKPSSGDNFKAKSIRVTDNGQKLQVTGCLNIGFPCRTATWVRVP